MSMMRAKIGILAAVLFALALVLALWPTESLQQNWIGALIRVGLVLAAVWLALPQLRMLPPWLLGAAFVLLIILARWPRYFLLGVIVVVVLAIVQPRRAARR